ncbi:hypothetical protein CW309_17730 [Pseudomonas hunanensis]|uniref:Uncharacterized protein n=1 Tax=Pseudomonas hunanensis TaxID=1247546 RepID=A0ACC9MZW0_9PSED|nr:hypothetical protein CW309_17730 [Pseudomonas hunanensis]
MLYPAACSGLAWADLRDHWQIRLGVRGGCRTQDDGYDTKADICGHGFRAMACSALVEPGLWSETAIEPVKPPHA